MFYLSPQGDRYYIGKPFTYNDIMYGTASATQAKFTELGFTRVIPETRPDSRFYIVSGPDDNGQFTTTPRDLAPLKENYVREQIESTQACLYDTDWFLLRANETSRGVTKAVPAEVTTYREQVRIVCETNVDAINATTTIAELQQVIDNLQEYPSIDYESYLNLEYVAYAVD